MDIISRIVSSIKSPKIIAVSGKSADVTAEAVFCVFKNYFKSSKTKNPCWKDVLLGRVMIVETDLGNLEKTSFFIKKSENPVLVATNSGDIPPDRHFFDGEKKEAELTLKLFAEMAGRGSLVLNFDDETVREIKDKSIIPTFTFGLQGGSDLTATDVFLTTDPFFGTNFKLNFKGRTIPIWLVNLFGKEQIYAALAAAAAAEIYGLNLIEVSESLKNYRSLKGRMRLLEGIKQTKILDDTESATPFSMTEALEIIGKIPEAKRRIAVLGDIIGIGKYSPEAHEAMGEKAAKKADLLFTFGLRAKFIGQGALQKGMEKEKIFQFDTIEQGKIKLQETLREGDFILVDGSKEMEMEKIVEEIKKL